MIFIAYIVFFLPLQMFFNRALTRRLARSYSVGTTMALTVVPNLLLFFPFLNKTEWLGDIYVPWFMAIGSGMSDQISFSYSGVILYGLVNLACSFAFLPPDKLPVVEPDE